jgi:branched-chain amino acid transport system substrate-binding protein
MRGRSLTAALLLLAIACGSARAADSTVTLGVVTAQSGPLAAAGKFQLNGIQLAVDAINAAGGVAVGADKVKLALKVYDTRCNAAEGASAMERLVSVDEVPVVLGEVCSPAAAAEAPVASDFTVPLIITVPTAPDLTRAGNPYLFRVNADNTQLNRALADYVTENKLLPLAFIAWNNDAGRGGVTGMKQMLPAGAPIAYTGFFNVGEVDFSAHVTNIRKSDARAVMLLMDEEPGALAIKQIRDAGLGTQLIGTLAMGSNRFLDRLDAHYLTGMAQYNAFPPNAPVPAIQNFSRAYRERFKEEAHGFAAQSYDAVFVAAAAMTAAGTARDGKRIRDALTRTDYQGVIGRIRFDKQNQAAPPVYITQWCEGGTRRIIFPAAMASACGGG